MGASTSFMENLGFRVREKARFTHVIAILRLDVRGKRFSAHGKTTERGNVVQKSLRFYTRFYNLLKINFPENHRRQEESTYITNRSRHRR